MGRKKIGKHWWETDENGSTTGRLSASPKRTPVKTKHPKYISDTKYGLY